MFTRFHVRRPLVRASLGGASASVATHATLLALAVGGVARDGVAGARGASDAGDGRGERLHWVGTSADRDAATPGTRGAPPIAYVVPGRGAPKVVSRAPDDARERERERERTARDAAPAPKARPRQRAGLLPLAFVPTPVLDSALLVSGVISSAPDLSRLVQRGDDFSHRPLLDAGDDRRGSVRLGAPSLTAIGAVDALPVALVTNPMPVYPTSLLRVGVEGTVVIEFRIDSAGGVDPASLQVVESSNALFTQAVRSVLPRLHFAPAQLGARAVGVLVRQPFVFVIKRTS